MATKEYFVTIERTVKYELHLCEIRANNKNQAEEIALADEELDFQFYQQMKHKEQIKTTDRVKKSEMTDKNPEPE